MSNAIPIKGKDNKKSAQKVSQSIPAHFYKTYIPPKKPSIKPMEPPAIPDFDGLPKISPVSKGIQDAGSYSLRENKHPMSMPARHGLMGPRTPFDIGMNAQNNDTEEKGQPNSLLSLYIYRSKYITRNFAATQIT